MGLEDEEIYEAEWFPNDNKPIEEKISFEEFRDIILEGYGYKKSNRTAEYNITASEIEEIKNGKDPFAEASKALKENMANIRREKMKKVSFDFETNDYVFAENYIYEF